MNQKIDVGRRIKMGNKIYVLISITRIKNNFMYIIQLHKEIEIYRNSKYS